MNSSKLHPHSHCEELLKVETDLLTAKMQLEISEREKLRLEKKTLEVKNQALTEKSDLAALLLKKAIKREPLPVEELAKVLGSKDSFLAKKSAAELNLSEVSGFPDFESGTKPEAKLAGLPSAKPFAGLPSANQVPANHFAGFGNPNPFSGFPMEKSKAQEYSQNRIPAYTLLASKDSRYSPLVKFRSQAYIFQFANILRNQSRTVDQVRALANERLTSGRNGGHYMGICGRSTCIGSRNKTNYFCVTCLLSTGAEGAFPNICQRHWVGHPCDLFEQGIRTTPDGLLAIIDSYLVWQAERERLGDVLRCALVWLLVFPLRFRF